MRVSLPDRPDVANECQHGGLVFRKLTEPYLALPPLALVGRTRGSPKPTTRLLIEAMRTTLRVYAD
ncbi:hypothetical protein [Bosea sp. TAB14]|uniref:hypothetical protein n=1 Tax=Bosea sp. TAB14 TaxID=3237481 RepID=UPI003F906D4B